jgi:hypothetical protein
LDSFVLVVSMVSNGPTTQDRSEMIYEVNYSSADDAYMVRTSNWETTADYPEPSTSESLQYTVGLKTCTESDGEYRVEEADPMANELQGVLLDMIDFTPIIANPVLVGQETVNGVETNHYTFLLDGLGVESGANVTKNEGEYWVAVDGQYLVKYYLAIEQRMEADGDFGGLQVSIELSSINQPIQITMPEGCQTAIVE